MRDEDCPSRSWELTVDQLWLFRDMLRTGVYEGYGRVGLEFGLRAQNSLALPLLPIRICTFLQPKGIKLDYYLVFVYM